MEPMSDEEFKQKKASYDRQITDIHRLVAKVDDEKTKNDRMSEENFYLNDRIRELEAMVANCDCNHA